MDTIAQIAVLTFPYSQLEPGLEDWQRIPLGTEAGRHSRAIFNAHT